MTKLLINQTNFTVGEVSPKLHGQSNSELYKAGVETATNVIVNVQGSLSRRNGFEYITKSKTASENTRFVKFQYNSTTSYVLEFGAEYIRFFNSDGIILDGSDPYEIESPYTDSQVPGITYVQSGATMYLVHPDVASQILVLKGDTDWTISDLEFSVPATIELGSLPTTTLTPAATTGSNITFTTGTAYLLQGDVGRQIINLGGKGKALITEILSATTVKASITEDFPNLTPITAGNWKLDLSPIAELSFSNRLKGEPVVVSTTVESANTSIYGPQVEILTVGYTNGVETANASLWDVTMTTDGPHGLVDGDTVSFQYVASGVFGGGTVSGVTPDGFVLVQQGKGGRYAPGNIYPPGSYGGGSFLRKVTTSTDPSSSEVPVFREEDEGKYIIVHGGVIKITNVLSSAIIEGVILSMLNVSSSTFTWSLEERNWTDERGHPRAVGIIQDRLVFAGTRLQPQTVWLSEIGQYDSFGVGPDEDDAIEINVTSTQVNEMSWLATLRDLVVGTAGSELTIDSGSNSGIAPSSIRSIPRTFRGSNRQQPMMIGSELVFIEGSNTKIRTFRYDFNLDGYTGEDLTILAEHLASEGIVSIAQTKAPEEMILAVTLTGDLLACTYSREQQVLGWTRLETYGDVKHVQTLSNGSEDEIWVIVKREVEESENPYHIERVKTRDGSKDTDVFSDSAIIMSNPLPIVDITLDTITTLEIEDHGLITGDSIIIKELVDKSLNTLNIDYTNISALNGRIYTVTVLSNDLLTIPEDTSHYNSQVIGTGTVHKRVSTITGLDHLEGKSVQVKGDGALQPDKVVSSGSITLDYRCGEAVVGLPYISTIKTLDFEYNIGLGSMQGQSSRWVRPLLRVYKSTLPFLNNEYLPARNASYALGQKVPLFTGILVYGNLDWSDSSSLTISVSEPLPLRLLSINGAIEAGVK